ncbi:MAG: ABC transporter substrate-binding protein [Nitrospira sp.]|nr:ABC transporter substrate-binding protein [Nitrospira sp.]
MKPETRNSFPQWEIARLQGRSHVLRLSTIQLTRFSLACLLAGLSVALSVAPLNAHEVAIMKSANIAPYNQAISGFKSSMPSETTFVEYDLKGDPDAGRKYASKIRASGADLVLAVGSKAAIAARLEILDIPIVYSMVLHPAKYDLRAPNIAGVSSSIPIGQQLSHLRALMPNLKRIGYLYDPDKTPPFSNDATNQARQLGITFIDRQVRTEEQVPTALRELLSEVDALWLTSDSTVLTQESFSFLLSAAFERRVPVIGFDPEFVRKGALISFWVDSTDVGRGAAHLAQTILAGSPVSSSKALLPKQRMSLNRGTAEYLGIAIPPSVLSLADEVR